MTKYKKLFIHPLVAFVITATLLVAVPQTARADDPEFDAITRHLKLFYNARRISIPFLGLANFFVKIVRPAGVKSFKVAIFEDLNFTGGKTDTGLGAVMRNALSPEWQPLLRVRSRDGEQVYVYGREAGENVKLMVVTIDKSDAVVARVKLSPKRLGEFLNNPKILGISVNR
ncbi:MAG: hypothetical protein QOH25_3915 [Acidobacteriota bacterium]|jgi:hypothetical protein|nr:hypothetical protein [Acidobacteriota bacterium]